MSAGGVIIIIDSLTNAPDVTIDELAQLRAMRNKPSLTWSERRFVLKLVKRALKS